MRKPVHWIGSSKKDLMTFPRPVIKDIGVALYAAQVGEQFAQAFPLVGFGGAGVIEIVSDRGGDTYRGVYTIKFENAVYVLHCFQKKSKRRSQVPKPDMELIRTRLKRAAEHHKIAGIKAGVNSGKRHENAQGKKKS